MIILEKVLIAALNKVRTILMLVPKKLKMD